MRRVLIALALLVTLTAGSCDTTNHQPCSDHGATKRVSNNGNITTYHCREVPGGEWQWEQ